ncbi:MAG: 4Fe-4S dicluster domain-containing protein [Theionarchaea archaeon]|nr:MAG: hypothetical protein AYK18_01670 [Theionarchaea archaeon DG-70]MBU7010535.1 4Fe-4S dicluster domain-containing protein [Theionarchaea archaeon]
MGIEIEVDHQRCTEPEKCGRCLKVCSPQVFALHPAEEDVTNPSRWMVDPVWVSFCIQCNRCVEECPEHAITIT